MKALPQVVVMLFLLLCGGASAAAADKTSFLSVSPVIGALRHAGLTAKPADVEFLSVVPAETSTADLRVTSWNRSSTEDLWVRLACLRANECLPFFVILHCKTLELPSLAPLQPAAQIAHGRGVVAEPPTVRAGSRAKLILLKGEMRITAPVTCLDSGSIGKMIRVKNLSTKRILLAEIVEKGLVRAQF